MRDEEALEAIAAFKPIADIACQNLASQVILKMDGNQWCATRPDFVNLQESLAGFGNSQADAIRDLLQKYKDENVKAHERCEKLCADVAVLEAYRDNLERHVANMKELAVLDEKYG